MEISSTMSRLISSHSANLISSSTGTTSKDITCKRKGGSTVYLKTHSLIEKRRRDKMNSFIDELASLVPTCKTKSRKLDKLSVLRMAVQHIKTLRASATNRYTAVNHERAFISHEDLKHLILRGADGFLFVIDCDRGKILFVSESVYKILNYSQNDLIGQSLFDYLHPKDIAKVKEQLSSADTAPQEKLIDAKSALLMQTDINPGSLKLCSGVRRSFFCRMKCNQNMEDEDFSSSCSKKNAGRNGFCTIHNTGYLKSWSLLDLDKNNEPDNNACNLSCLVAVGRLHSHVVSQPARSHVKVKPVEFVSRHAVDGKFVFLDQRATAILAYLPQELLGTSFYEYFHEDDISHLAECHRQVLQMRAKINTNCYKLKIKDGSFITLRSCWFSFMNPWTKEVEYIVSINTVVIPSHGRPESSYHLSTASPHTMAHSVQIPGEGEPNLQTVPGIRGGTRAFAGKVGRMIEKELLDNQRMDICTVTSEGQKVFEQRVSSVVSTAMKSLVVGKIENMGREKEQDNQAQEFSTTQEAATSVQDEQDVFEALDAVGSGAPSSGQAEGGQDVLESGVITDYVACMSAIPGMPS